jgi:hypothetical protein
MKTSDAVVAVGALIGLLALSYMAGCLRERENQAEAIRRAVDETASLADSIRYTRHVIDSLRSVERADTVLLMRWRDRWRVSVDTLELSDTIVVPGPVVREIVYVADSTIRACTTALATCQVRASEAEKLVSLYTSRDTIQLQRIGQLSRSGRIRLGGGTLVGAAVGVLATLLIHK